MPNGVNREAVEALDAKLKAGEDITYSDIGDVIGNPFWELIIMGFLDSQDAARAIQLAVARIRTADEEEEDDDLDD